MKDRRRTICHVDSINQRDKVDVGSTNHTEVDVGLTNRRDKEAAGSIIQEAADVDSINRQDKGAAGSIIHGAADVDLTNRQDRGAAGLMNHLEVMGIHIDDGIQVARILVPVTQTICLLPQHVF